MNALRVGDLLCNCPGNTTTLISGRASAKLIDYNQRIWCGRLKCYVQLHVDYTIICILVKLTLMMPAVSIISTINVLSPLLMLSSAPIRPKMESTIDILALSHGTNEPICAIITAVPTDRMYVLFPPIFGPVIMYICISSTNSNKQHKNTKNRWLIFEIKRNKPFLKTASFATKITSSCNSKHGCRSSFKSNVPKPSANICGRT